VGWQDKVEDAVKKSFYGLFGPGKVLGGVYSERFIEKSIAFTIKALNFSLNIAVFMSVGFLVFKWFYPRYGFEKTILLLLMSLIALMRGFMMHLKHLAQK